MASPRAAAAPMDPVRRKRIWGWWAFDWASQPYNTLLLTFVFSPYFAEQVIAQLVAGGMDQRAAEAQAQAYWGYGLTISGLVIAVLAPVLGSIADNRNHRRPWIVGFSVLYVVGASALWWTQPGAVNVPLTLLCFGTGLIGMEFATIFTNAQLPTLGRGSELGTISGTGWAWGYVGGVIALAIMLLFFAGNAQGVTFLGIAPILGLDPALREGTRFVGPWTALWYATFMIPYWIWVKDPRPLRVPGAPGVRQGLRELWRSLRALPANRSLFAYLGSSMFYRDALNGMYTFGGIYALGVLDWSVVEVGVFGIVAAITGAVFAWIGGKADRALGPRPVISASIVTLIVVSCTIISIGPGMVLGLGVPAGSALPTVAFYICGAAIGAAGGALQSSSRTMMVRQSPPDRMTESFGFYALAGKATSFVAPFLIAVVSEATGDQRLGITPLIALFTIGLILLRWVRPGGAEIVR